jgi:chromosome segregation ATPase
MHHLKSSNTQMQLELSTFASTKEQLKDELHKCHVQIARYEEREKDIVGYQREISRLKDDIGRDSSGIGKLEGENAALKKEIANMLEQYATNINKVRDVANQKIEIETEMRHRLQAEVREAKGAIRDMHKEVKDRNMLLSVLEERLQTMGDAEDKVTRDQERRLKIRAADIKPIGATGGISATVDAYEKHIGSRARGEGLYGVAKLPADLSEIGGVKIAEKSRARKMATEALDRRSSADKLTKEVISRGGLAWVVS